MAREFPSLGMVELRVPVGDEEATAARLARRPDVLFAEPDYRAYAQVSPNDPDFAAGKQWALAIMNAPAAWSVTTGSQSAVIAVLDTGIDIRAPGPCLKTLGEPRRNRR